MNLPLIDNPISKYKFDSNKVKSKILSTEYYTEQAKKILENYDFIQMLSDYDKTKLIKNIKIRRYHHNQKIYHQNQNCQDINIIVDGCLKLGWNLPNGKYHTNFFMPSGTLINIAPILTNKALMSDHIAQGETILANISGEIFTDVVQSNAAVLFKLLKLICERVQIQRADRCFNTIESLRIQLARELVFLVDYHSYQTQDKIFLQLKLNQENFSELLQTTRQRINKEFAWFSEQGILEVKYNQIHILDYAKLEQLIQNNYLDTNKFI